MQRPCARGEAGADGHRCPYVEHEPLTDAGWQAWDLVTRGVGLQIYAPYGSLSPRIDLPVALSVGAALGYEVGALAELLPAAEAGLVAAFRHRLASEATP